MVRKCLILLLLASGGWANPFSLPEPEPYFVAVSPIFGFDPAYGTLLGGAWFSYPTGEVKEATESKELFLVARLGLHGSLQFQHRQPDFAQGFGLDYNLSVNNFFDYQTAPDSTEIIDTYEQLSLNGSVTFHKPINQNFGWYIGSYLQKQWHENEANDAQTYVFAGATADKRDDPVNSHRGWYANTEVKWQAAAMHSEAEDSSSQLSADLRYFVPVTNQQTLALRSLAQTSSGENLQPTAGGDLLLRGYLGGQLEGQSLVGVQSEYRFPIWQFIRALVFYEWVALNENDQTQPYQSAGVGFRFGLPPDQSMSVRWDIAVNDQGEWQTFVNFNQVF